MRTFEEINQEYANLCIKLGDLYAKKRGIESQLEALVEKAQELEKEAAVSKVKDEDKKD